MARKSFHFAIVRRKGDTVFTYRLERTVIEVRNSKGARWKEVLAVTDRSGRWQINDSFRPNAYKLAIQELGEMGWEVVEIFYK